MKAVSTLFEFTKKEKKQDGTEVVHKYALLKPTHSLREEADELNATETSKLVAKGVLTRKMLRKRIVDAGIYSEEEKAAIIKLYEDFDTKLLEFRKLIEKEEKDEEAQGKINEEIVDLRQRIQQFEIEQMSLYDTTAEVLARNRVLFWWTLVLLLEDKDGKYINVFKTRDYSKLKVEYDTFIDDNQYNNELLLNVGNVVTSLFLGQATTKEELERVWERVEKDSEPSNEEEVKVTEAKPEQEKVEDKVEAPTSNEPA